MKKQVFNPYLPLTEYVPDGEPHVFGDRVYLYGSHDRFDGTGFCYNDYVSYSAPVTDLTDWRFEGVIYKKTQDPRNQMGIPVVNHHPLKSYFPGGENKDCLHAFWAPDVTKGPDGRYYLYYCLDYLNEIGVAVCDTPAGKYEYLGLVRHADGTPLGDREGDLVQFDPGLFVEGEDIYLYSGNSPVMTQYDHLMHGSTVMKLETDMLTIKEEPKPLIPDTAYGIVSESENDAACPAPVDCISEAVDGNSVNPASDFAGHEFFEASSIRKVGDTYYFVYSSLLSHELCYCTSKYPDRDYRFGGTLVSIGDIGIDGRTDKESVNCLGNTHGGIEKIGEKWYVFYHRQTNRSQYSRQACAEEIFFDENGHIEQAAVTSCGLNDGPLMFEGTYPASICCHLTGKDGATVSLPDFMGWKYPFVTQDGGDYHYGEPDSGLTIDPLLLPKEPPTSYIANFADGSTAGYKYYAGDGKYHNVKIMMRGRAVGELQAACDIACKKKIGTAMIDLFTDNWTEIMLSVEAPEDTFPFYLHFEGEGACDLLSFEII